MTKREQSEAIDDLTKAMKALLKFADIRECQHDETYRGGSIWTICEGCGASWADDRGGKPEYKEPKEFTEARALVEKYQRHPLP